jgi:hypothetical protein
MLSHGDGAMGNTAMIGKTNTIEFLLSNAAKAGRVTRMNGYAALGEVNPTGVVHVETDKGMFELDADNMAHAEVLMKSWIETGTAKTARAHMVASDGSLVNSSPIYDFRHYVY